MTYLVGFLLDVVPRNIDTGSASPAVAMGVDALLFVVFGIQHSVMARPAFKARIERVLPPHAERATFVLASAFAVILIIAGWQPLPQSLWALTGTTAVVISALMLAGVAIAVA